MIKYSEKIKQLKARMLEVAYKNQQGFLPSSFSILDVLAVLYYEVMNFNVDEGEYVDEFVLSKGHAALALYAILEDKNVIASSVLDSWGEYDSHLCLMAERNLPGVLFTTGSLGHGFPEAVGLAYAKKILGKKGKIFVLIGDGELNEGSNWEAIQVASRLKLNNLVCIIDNNKSSLFAEEQKGLREKFEAFECLTVEVDGHNETELLEALKKECATVRMLIANTVKGKGCFAMEENPALWHSKAPNKEEYLSFLKEALDDD